MTLHRSFYFMYRLGLLKNKPAFKYHYFIQKMIQDDYVVIDIGANLGYFAKTFSRLVPNGKLIAIEPLPQFHAILDYFIGKKENVELHNVALGKTSGSITMVLPKTNGMMRTGLPHVMRSEGENREHFMHHGGEKFAYVPCLNDSEIGLDVIQSVVLRELQGWV